MITNTSFSKEGGMLTLLFFLLFCSQATIAQNKNIVWREDFGHIDSFSVKPFDGISAEMRFHSNSEEEAFGAQHYAVTCAADSAIIGNPQNKHPEKENGGIATQPNDAFLYMAIGKAAASEAKNLLVDKAINGPFCNDKPFAFSFSACNPCEQGKVTIIGRVVDDGGVILGEETISLQGTKTWVHNSIAFLIENDYKRSIHLQIINAGENESGRLAIDDMAISVGGDLLSEAIAGIDNTESRYLAGFDCAEEPPHTFGLTNSGDWEEQFQNIGCAWQRSTDGGANWEFHASGRNIAFDEGGNGLVEYRAVVAESEAVAEEVARKGRPSDPCQAYAISNSVAFVCNPSGCKAPALFLAGEETIDICSNATEAVELSVTKNDDTNIDRLDWFSSPAGKNQWNLLNKEKSLTIKVLPNSSTDYLLIAANDTCASDSIFAHINVHQAITLEKIKDTTICVKSDIEFVANVLSGKPTEYIWNNTTKESNAYTLEKVTETQTVTLTASDGTCSETMTFSVGVEDSVRINIDIDKTEICMGEAVTLNTQTREDETKAYTLKKSEYGMLTKMTLQPSVTERPENPTTYTLTGESRHCPAVTKEVSVAINEIPTAPIGTLKVDYLMEEAENGSFKNLLEQNPKAVVLEKNHTYTWYDADENELGATAPTPTVLDPTSTEDISLAYYVGRTSEAGCAGPKAKVTVNIYSSPAPTTQDVEYCLNETPKPLGAETSLSGNSQAADFDLIWYDAKEGGSKLEGTPTPNTAKEGSTTYFVSQKNRATQAESGRVPLTVTVHKVETPTLGDNKTSYCKEEETEALKATATDNNHSLVWTLDGEKTSANSINTYVNATTTYRYEVYQTYTIAEDHVCEGPKAAIEVKVTSVNAPTGSFKVNYTRLEAENNGGFFANSLLIQDAEVAIAEKDHTLLWYDAEQNSIGTTAPTPSFDPNWGVGENVEFTYYVAQQETTSGCVGETRKVTASVNDAPSPTVKELNYCLNGKPNERSFKDDLLQAAEINLIPGGEPLSHYRLVWFNTEDEYKTNTAGGQSEPILTPNTEVAGVQHFYVCQLNTLTNAISAPSTVRVTIHPLPALSTKEIPAQCSYDGEEVTFDLNDGLDRRNDPIDYSVAFYSTGTLTEKISEKVTQAGSYYAVGSYEPTSGLTCRSEAAKITTEIQSLSTPVISGDSSVCPNTSVTLQATATNRNTEGTIEYAWSCDKPNTLISSRDYQITTSPLSDTDGEKYNFSVTATVGVCQKESAPFTVGIGAKPIEGTLTITEEGSDQPIATITESFGNEFYACGGNLTFTADFKKSEGNYVWSNGQTGATITEEGMKGDKTYTLSFTNECPSTVEFTIHTIPVALFNEPENFNGCEGAPISRELEVNCREEDYSVTWTTPAGETIQGKGKEGSLLSVEKAKMKDNGSFRYEVTNRACRLEGSFNSTVMQAIRFAANDTTILERGRDTTLRISFPQGVPQLVEWKEKGKTVNLEEKYEMRSIYDDHTFEIIMSDPDYCETRTAMTILMDATPMLTTLLTDSICASETTTLTVDTTGTGPCRDKSKNCTLSIRENVRGITRDITDQARLTDGVYEIEVSPTADATYTATLTYGEKRRESVEQIVVLAPIIIQSVPQPAVCGGETISFEIEVSPSDASVKWEADVSIKGKAEGRQLTVAPIFAKSDNHEENHPYNFTVGYAFCQPKNGTVNVRVDEPFGLEEIEGDKVICRGGSTRLSAANFDASSYRWNDADSTRNATINVTPKESTLYTVDMRRGECTAKAEFDLTVASLPVITSIDSVGVRSRYIKTASGPGTQPFTYWMDNKETSDDPLFDNMTFAKHTAHVEDANGCKTEMTFEVVTPTLQLKPFFSPNGDGMNDVWDLSSLAELYPTATVKIFDRRGTFIFECTATERSWDGTYNGYKMPSTDYWYEVKVEEIKKTFVGHFTLLRDN